MSIRRIIEQLVDDPAQREAFRQSPEQYFADHGIEDTPTDLVGSAFVHYADSAPIEHADAVSGIATRFGPVPFDESDLPDGVTDGEVDPFSTLGGVEPPLGEFEMTEDDATGGGPTDHTDETTADDTATDDTATDAPTDEAPADDTTPDESSAEQPDDSPSDDSAVVQLLAETGDLLGEYGDDADLGIGSDDFGDDDPFFEEVTADDVDFVTHASDVGSHALIEDAPALLDDTADDAGYESFTEEFGHDYADIDPGDLDLDDI